MTGLDHDNSIEELAAEQAEADAWEEFLSEGDPSEMLDAYISEDQGESQALIRAYRNKNQADLTSAAYKMARKMEAIAEGLVNAS